MIDSEVHSLLESTYHAPVHPAKETASELTVTIKDEEKTLKAKFLLYDEYNISQDDPIIKDCIARTLKDFGSDPTDIRVRINLVVL